MAEAEALYGTLLRNLHSVLGHDRARQIAALQVFWPSKRFADEELIPASGEPRLGSASAAGGDIAGEAIKRRLDGLMGIFDNDDAALIEGAQNLVDQLDDSPKARREFADHLRALIGVDDVIDDDGSDRFATRPGDELMSRLIAPLRMIEPDAPVGRATSLEGRPAAIFEGDARGAAAGLGSAFNGVQAAAWRLLNYATYYQMKKRAGHVGAGLNEVLAHVRSIPSGSDLRVHLVGHSFGARVVTAAVVGPRALLPWSMVLLQGAYSHHGLTSNFKPGKNGAFHSVVADNKVKGPIAITHTVNDRAVGVAYAIASRIAGDNRSAFGDENDPFGGIGRNGAVKLPANRVIAATLLAPGTSYDLAPGKVTNFRSDSFISGHGDVANEAVASLMAAALAPRG
jgi:hypothetical protein